MVSQPMQPVHHSKRGDGWLSFHKEISAEEFTYPNCIDWPMGPTCCIRYLRYFYLEAGPRQADTSAGGLEPTGLPHSLAVTLSFYGDK